MASSSALIRPLTTQQSMTRTFNVEVDTSAFDKELINKFRGYPADAPKAEVKFLMIRGGETREVKGLMSFRRTDSFRFMENNEDLTIFKGNNLNGLIIQSVKNATYQSENLTHLRFTAAPKFCYLDHSEEGEKTNVRERMVKIGLALTSS